MKNYYLILGVDENVSQEVLEAVYKSFVKKHDETGVDISEITEAYNVISNPDKRSEYDQKLSSNETDAGNDCKTFENDIVEFDNPDNQAKGAKKGFAAIAIIAILIIVLVGLISSITESSTPAEYNDIPSVESETNGESEYYDENENYDKDITPEEKPESLMKEKYYIEEGTDFSEGVAFIKCIQGDVLAINTKGDKLFEIEGCSDLDEISSFENGVFIYNDCMYNGSGEIIASTQKSGFDEVLAVSSNNLVVTKLEESYKGDVKLYGVINTRGEWEVPLSPTGKWSHQYNYNSKILYSWNDNVFEWEESFKIADPSDDDDEYEFYENFYVVSSRWDYEYYKVFDTNGKLIIDLYKAYDFLHYIKYIDYYNGYLVFEADNGTGTDYVYFINSNADFIVEPFKSAREVYYNYDLGENGFLYLNNSGNNYSYSFYEYNGNIIEYTNQFDSIYSFSEGLAIAKVDYEMDSEIYYINHKEEIIIE